MKTFMTAFLIFLTSIGIALAQANDPASQPAEQVRTLEYARFEAQSRRDNSSLNAILDDQLMWVNSDGVPWTKSEYLGQMRKPGSNLLRVTPESMTVQVFGPVAIVVGIYREKGVKQGHPYTLRCRFIDTWQIKRGKWMCIASVATASVS